MLLDCDGLRVWLAADVLAAPNQAADRVHFAVWDVGWFDLTLDY